MLARRPQEFRFADAPRSGAAFVAAFALLLQMAFAAPAALWAAAEVSGMQGALCTKATDKQGQPAPQLPAPHQAHCPLCHAQAMPLAPVPPAVALLVVLACVAAVLLLAPSPPAASRRFEPYASRAPPASA